MSSVPLPAPPWKLAADQLTTPTLTLIHEDFKTAYSASYAGAYAAIMDGYADYLAFLIAKFDLGRAEILGHLQSYRNSRLKSSDQSFVGTLFFTHLRAVQQALRGWRPKTLMELAADFVIDSHQAKHYNDSAEKGAAKFDTTWFRVHNLMRTGAAAAAQHYHDLGFTCFPDAVFTLTNGGVAFNIGKDGKGGEGGAETSHFRIQIWAKNGAAGGHGYPISVGEFDAYKKKKLDPISGKASPTGTKVGDVDLRWEDVPRDQVGGEKPFKLR
jgi:hypothetical protein